MLSKAWPVELTRCKLIREVSERKATHSMDWEKSPISILQRKWALIDKVRCQGTLRDKLLVNVLDRQKDARPTQECNRGGLDLANR